MDSQLTTDYKKLELDKILNRLLTLSNNNLSKELVMAMKPHGDQDLLEVSFAENQEALSLLRLAIYVPVLRFEDIRAHLDRSLSGGVLDLVELSDIKNWVSLNEAFLDAGESFEKTPHLQEWIDPIMSMSSLKKRLDMTIDEDGDILDEASKKLHSLRRARLTISERIKNRMEALVQSEPGKKLLQDQLITIRNNRYVVPLKAQNKGKLPGIIHDQSSTGATIYVEPNFAVELNNNLQQNRLDEGEEIRKILREVSREVGTLAKDIHRNMRMLAMFDHIMARAKLSQEMDAVAPKLNCEGRVYLRAARHPLITGHVVPNDIMLDHDHSCVIITGPNTGGKTVVLKTLGLLVLMAKMGLNIPCDTHSEIALFDEVFADIGDEQSIEQSLSTYSSHMKNIIRIVNKVTPDSLVLLDELGAGTDPTEGAALASSLLKYFNDRHIRTMATTHYGELKVFAYQHDRVVNASVEFDHESLRPTYKLLMGTPGLSNALTIASSLGLSDELVASAKSYISEDELQISNMIEDLEDKRKETETMAAETATLREEVARLKETLAHQEERLAEKKRTTMEKAWEEANQIVLKAQYQAEEIIEMLKVDAQGLDKNAVLQMANEARSLLRDQKSSYTDQKKAYEKTDDQDYSNLKLGDTVQITSLNQKGHLLALPDRKGEVVVQVGIMKTTVSVEDIVRVKEDARPAKETYQRSIRTDKSKNISPSIDLRGTTSDEAYSLLEKYLDDALLAGLEKVRIIHGKGTGALMRFTQNYLESHPSVQDQHLADPREGGSGVTVVILK